MQDKNHSFGSDVITKTLKKGEIYVCDLDAENSQTNNIVRYTKARPVVIASTEKWNMEHHPIIIPLTTSDAEHVEGFPSANIVGDMQSKIVVKALQPVNSYHIMKGNSILKDNKIEEIDDMLIEMFGLEYKLQSNKAKEDYIHELEAKIEGLQNKVAELNSTIKLRDKQLKTFSNRSMTTTPNVNTAACTISTKEPKITKPVKTESPKETKGLCVSDITQDWVEGMCKEFLEYVDSGDVSVRSIMGLFNIRSTGTYYNIVKSCREKIK